MDILFRQVGPYTLVEWMIGMAVAWVVVSVIQKLAKKVTAGTGTDFVAMRCAGCGWKGKVSRFHRTCPKCGDRITRTETDIPPI